MRFTEAVKSFFANYANFSGRTQRSGYWYVVLFSLLMGIGLGIIASIIQTQLLTNLYTLAILDPLDFPGGAAAA